MVDNKCVPISFTAFAFFFLFPRENMFAFMRCASVELNLLRIEKSNRMTNSIGVIRLRFVRRKHFFAAFEF